jgi:hypothetical protein
MLQPFWAMEHRVPISRVKGRGGGEATVSGSGKDGVAARRAWRAVLGVGGGADRAAVLCVMGGRGLDDGGLGLGLGRLVGPKAGWAGWWAE